MSWWPYGKLAEDLADAFQAGDMEEAHELAALIKEEKRKRDRYEEIIHQFCLEVEACRWGNAEALLEEAQAIGQLAAYDITFYTSQLHFERDFTVLDRIVENTE